MTYGALIVAAGMSSRMGDYKPMMEIGSISVAQRVVSTFRQANIDKIVVVTGFNAQKLEHHLSGNGIVFLRNENYETTQMFDSAKIGLEYLKDKVDRIFFTPVDIPLFTVATIQSLMKADGDVVRPKCGKEYGHPILISADSLSSILSYSGNNGLKGAIENCGLIKEIRVSDEGTLHDADTQEDFSRLLEYHNRQLFHPEIKVSLSREKDFFNEDMALLLSLVDETGSVRESCSRMQISYSSGWGIINTLESQLSTPLIQRNQGGGKGGRSCLTEYGKEFLNKYYAYQKELKNVSQKLFNKYFSDIN